MIKLILILLMILIFVIIMLPVFLIILLVKCFKPMWAARMAQPFIKFVFWMVIVISGSKGTVNGKENIPKEPVLFVANHRSIFDIILGYMTLPALHPTAFVAKKELKKLPIVNLWMFLLMDIFIDRSSPKEGLKSIKRAIEQVGMGDSIFIMPAGTRCTDDNVGEFKAGSFKIAERTGIPVVPVAITATEEIFENQLPKIRKAKVSISYGEPIYTKDLSRDEFRDVPVLAQARVAELYEKAMGRAPKKEA